MWSNDENVVRIMCHLAGVDSLKHHFHTTIVFIKYHLSKKDKLLSVSLLLLNTLLEGSENLVDEKLVELMVNLSCSESLTIDLMDEIVSFCQIISRQLDDHMF